MKKQHRPLVILLMSFGMTASIFGSSVDIDSLFAVYTGSKGGKSIHAANEILEELAERKHISKYNPYAADDHPLEVDAMVYGGMALYNSDRGNYENAILYNGISLDNYRKLDDSTLIIHKLQNLYVCYASTGQYDKALDCLKESLDIATVIDDRSMIANTLLSMGSLHAHNQNDMLAIEAIKKGLDMERSLNDTVKILWALNSLSQLYTSTGRFDKAQTCINEAYVICSRGGYVSSMINCRISMAMIHKKQEEWDKALACLDTIMTEAVANNYSGFVCSALFQMGETYFKSGKSHVKAEEYLLRCIVEAEKIDQVEDLMMAYDMLYMINKDKNAALALKYYEKSVGLYKQTQKEETQNQLNNFHVKYNTAEKEHEIERQQNVIRQQEQHRFILMAGIVVCIIILALLVWLLIQRIARNRMLAEMNSIKDKFFSIISHDLKNPAIAQRDALQALINNSRQWDEQLLMQYYKEMLSSADSQLELLYNLLNWAQAQTGRMPFIPVSFDIVAALQSDITLIKNISKRKGVVFNCLMSQSAIITGDSNMITIIVRNLLTNAVKFAPSEQSVTLTVEQSPEGVCTIIVSDTGIGMSITQQQNLFIFAGNRSRRGTAGETGNGLGLIVCKELVEKHGSTLHVESREGEGSRFWFTLTKNIK